MSTVQATDLKELTTSEDGKQLNIKFATKYVGDLDVVLPIASLEGFMGALERVRAAARPQAAQAANQVTVGVPKTWLVTVDQKRGAIVLVFDHQAANRAGYALNAESTRKLVDALAKNVAAIEAPAKN